MSHLLESLISASQDKLEQISEFDGLADDISTLYNQHLKLHSKLDTQSASNYDTTTTINSAVPKSKNSKDTVELTGAALEANRVISAILAQYQNKTAYKQQNKNKNKLAIANSSGVFADCYQFVRSFTKLDDDALFEQVLNPQSLDHDAIVENLTTLTQLLGIALERKVVHVTKNTANKCDLNCLLNTCDTISDNLPCPTLVFDLSDCPDCAPIQGCILSRLTYLKPANKTQLPFSSPNNDEAIFLEELGLSLNIDGQWYPIGLAATLDNDRTISDLVRELSYYAVHYLEQEEVAPLSEREQLAEIDWDEAQSIIDPKLQDDAFSNALYHLFKYLTYTLTHLELLTNKEQQVVNLTKVQAVKLPTKSDDMLKALSDRITLKEFEHYYI